MPVVEVRRTAQPLADHERRLAKAESVKEDIAALKALWRGGERERREAPDASSGSGTTLSPHPLGGPFPLCCHLLLERAGKLFQEPKVAISQSDNKRLETVCFRGQSTFQESKEFRAWERVFTFCDAVAPSGRSWQHGQQATARAPGSISGEATSDLIEADDAGMGDGANAARVAKRREQQ